MTRISLPLFALALGGLAACTDPAYLTGDTGTNDQFRKTKGGAILGGLIGVGASKIAGGNVLVGGAMGAGAGALIGSYLDQQEADLRSDMDSRVKIENTGDRLVVTLPQDILFASDSDYVSPDLTDDLAAVGKSLQKYPNSTVQIIGHTDNTGSAEHNQALSVRRANAVADRLMESGVAFSRIQTIGRGEDQPVASNLTSAGKAQNRRVEIVILPNS